MSADLANRLRAIARSYLTLVIDQPHAAALYEAALLLDREIAPQDFVARYKDRAIAIAKTLDEADVPLDSPLRVLVVDKEGKNAGVEVFIGLRVVEGGDPSEAEELRKHVNIAPELRGRPAS